ncbi:MAG: ABC transporter substrate-binding protein [Deltaproteobacteria bacterium]|nr:ABC transporter substrate-binding protein [Deltaproteobacteria bacterium]
MKTSQFFAVLSLIFALVVQAYAADKIVADFGGLGGFQSTMWVAKDLKIFDKNGLDVDLIMITGGARSVAVLLSGNTQFATGSATTPLLATARGSDLVIVAASYNYFPFSIVSKPDIRSPKDLRGKRLGILNFGGSHDLAHQLAFKEWGLKRQEVNVIPLGDQPTRLAALLAGNIDATIMSLPHLLVAVKAGYRVLGDMGDMRTRFSQSTVYLRRSYLRENRDIAKRFLKAYSEAVHVLKTDRERSIKVMGRRMRVEDQEILNETYNYFGRRFSFPPRVDMAGIKDTLDFYAERTPEVKNRNPQDFVDHTLLDELEKEGFFKSLGS